MCLFISPKPCSQKWLQASGWTINPQMKGNDKPHRISKSRLFPSPCLFMSLLLVWQISLTPHGVCSKFCPPSFEAQPNRNTHLAAFTQQEALLSSSSLPKTCPEDALRCWRRLLFTEDTSVCSCSEPPARLPLVPLTKVLYEQPLIAPLAVCSIWTSHVNDLYFVHNK